MAPCTSTAENAVPDCIGRSEIFGEQLLPSGQLGNSVVGLERNHPLTARGFGEIGIY